MIPQQSTIDAIGKSLKCLGLSSLLYPLERLQTIQQIQSTYSSHSLKETKFIISQSFHNGIKASFRGYMSFMTKASILTFTSQFANLKKNHNQNYQKISQMLQLGFIAISYALVYPYEIVNIRMSAQVERNRYYSNIRECFSKIKKNEGMKTLYRGFLYSYVLLASQLSAIQLIRQHFQHEKKSEWEKIGLLAGAIAVSQLFIYPFSSVKKLYQINGAMGHDYNNFSLFATIKRAKMSQILRGYPTRIINLLSYSLLYLLVIDEDPSK